MTVAERQRNDGSRKEIKVTVAERQGSSFVLQMYCLLIFTVVILDNINKHTHIIISTHTQFSVKTRT